MTQTMNAAKSDGPEACTTFLDLDSSALSLIAKKGIHRELRSTSKRLQEICDSCRTHLHVKDLCSAGKSHLSISKWPRLTHYRLSMSARESRQYQGADEESATLVWPNVLLAATFGKELSFLEVSLPNMSAQVDGSLLGEVLKQCRTTLETLRLEEIVLTGALQQFVSELQNCKLKSLSLLAVCFSSDGDEVKHLWSSELVSGSLGPSLQRLELSIYAEEETTEDDWQKAAQLLTSLEELKFSSMLPEEMLAGFFAGCSNLRVLDYDYDGMEEYLTEGDRVLRAAQQCPHLESLVMSFPVSTTQLAALPGKCQALRHLKVHVDIDDFCSLEEVRDGLGGLRNVEHLEVAFFGVYEGSRESLVLEAVTSGLLAMRKLKALQLDSPEPALVTHVHGFIWALPAMEVMICKDLREPMDATSMAKLLETPFKVKLEDDERVRLLTIKRR